MRLFYRKRNTTLICACLFFLLACDATFSVGYPTSVPSPFVEVSTPTTAPSFSQTLTLVSVPFIETDPGTNFPTYTLTAQTPQLTGSDDPRVIALNQRLNELVKSEMELFRKSFQELPGFF